MGISGNNSVGSVQTWSESKQRGGQADGGNISHHTGNGPAAVRVPERHPPAAAPQSGGDVLRQLGQNATFMCLILFFFFYLFGSKLTTLLVKAEIRLNWLLTVDNAPFVKGLPGNLLVISDVC